MKKKNRDLENGNVEKNLTEKNRVSECNKVTKKIMVANLLISTIFLIVGFFGKSMATLSEGIDSLTDAGSSLLLLLGFKVSSREPDWLHPNGHKKFEYIIGLLISEVILFAAFSLGKKSVLLFFHPETAPASILLLIVAVVGIIGKLLMTLYINNKNKVLKSASLKAYYKNTLADVKGICLVAISAILQPMTSFPVDAVVGLLLAIIIGFDGIKSFIENVSLLIGEGNDPMVERSHYVRQ